MTQQTADDDIASLKQTVDQTKKDKDAAVARATAAEGEVEKARNAAAEAITQRTRSDKAAAVNAIAAADQEIANLEGQLAAAMTAGDAAAMSKATRGIASAQNRLDGWTNQKARIEDWEKRALAEAERRIKETPAEQPQQGTYSAESKAWLDRHPEIRDNTAQMQRVVRAHYAALGEEIDPDTAKYFEFIEKRMGLSKDEGTDEDTTVADVPVVEADAAAAAAAPSRGNGNGKSQRSAGQLRLTSDEVDTAIISFPHLKRDEAIKEYAKNKVALQKEGRLQA